MGTNLISIAGITSKIKNVVDEKTNSLLSGFDAYNMDPDAIESKIEEYTSKMDEIKKYTDTASLGIKVAKAVADPSQAIGLVKDLAIQQFNSNETVQKLKEEVVNKAKEKAMEVPEVKTFVDKAQEKINDITDVGIPEDVRKLMNNPEDASDENADATKYVYQALIDTGLTRQIISIANEQKTLSTN